MILSIHFISHFAFWRSIISGLFGFAVKVSPAVVLLGGGSATAARTGCESRQFPESLISGTYKSLVKPANAGK
jgi:hypothetical protein